MSRTQLTAPVNGVRLNVVQSGEGSPILVFLHYWGGSSRTWSAVMDLLSADHRCVAIDFRGWGASDKSASDYGLETLADDVEGVVSQLGLQEFVVVGHSMGGKVAQLIGGRNPPGLKGLVLVAPAPPTPLSVSEEQRQGMLASYQTRGGVEAVVGILSARRLTDGQREQVIEDTLGGAAEAKRAWPETGMTADFSGEAAKISVPVSVIVGSADTVESEASLRAAFAGLVPVAAFTVLPGVGHLAPLEAPDEVAAAIRASTRRSNVEAGHTDHLSAMVFLSPPIPFENDDGTFSPVTSTLFLGREEAVLIDAQHTVEEVTRLGDMIEASGRRLTTIYITHGHGDHYFGIGPLLKRFPSARAVSTAGVVKHIKQQRTSDLALWRGMFGDRLAACDINPEVLDGDLTLEGRVFGIIEVDQADVSPSTVVFLRETGVMVPGDLLYNRMHVMLGLSAPADWERWLANIETVARLQPKMIVCGHKRPEASDLDVARIMDETKHYIRSFAEEAPHAAGAEALVARMQELFPEHGNVWTLRFSAKAYFARSDQGAEKGRS